MSRHDDIVAALQEERRGYVARNLPDRVKLVDAELARMGAKAPAAAVAPPAPEKAVAPKPSRGRKAGA